MKRRFFAFALLFLVFVSACDFNTAGHAGETDVITVYDFLSLVSAGNTVFVVGDDSTDEVINERIAHDISELSTLNAAGWSADEQPAVASDVTFKSRFSYIIVGDELTNSLLPVSIASCVLADNDALLLLENNKLYVYSPSPAVTTNVVSLFSQYESYATALQQGTSLRVSFVGDSVDIVEYVCENCERWQPVNPNAECVLQSDGSGLRQMDWEVNPSCGVDDVMPERNEVCEVEQNTVVVNTLPVYTVVVEGVEDTVELTGQRSYVIERSVGEEYTIRVAREGYEAYERTMISGQESINEINIYPRPHISTNLEEHKRNGEHAVSFTAVLSSKEDPQANVGVLELLEEYVIDSVVLDSEYTKDPSTDKLLVVGSPCDNTVAASLLGLQIESADFSSDCGDYVANTRGKVQILRDQGNVQLLVMSENPRLVKHTLRSFLDDRYDTFYNAIDVELCFNPTETQVSFLCS